MVSNEHEVVFSWLYKISSYYIVSFSAYVVREQHYFMETVELKGLKYDPKLQDEDSGYSIVLSSVLKNKVRNNSLTPQGAWYTDFSFTTVLNCDLTPPPLGFLADKKCLHCLISITSLC